MLQIINFKSQTPLFKQKLLERSSSGGGHIRLPCKYNKRTNNGSRT